MLMFQYLCTFRYIVYDKKATFNVRTCGRHSCSTGRCGPSAFRFISCVFLLYFVFLGGFFGFRLFLLSRLCLIVFLNIYWGLFLSGIKISAQYRKKELTEFFPKSFSCCS